MLKSVRRAECECKATADATEDDSEDAEEDNQDDACCCALCLRATDSIDSASIGTLRWHSLIVGSIRLGDSDEATVVSISIVAISSVVTTSTV